MASNSSTANSTLSPDVNSTVTSDGSSSSNSSSPGAVIGAVIGIVILVIVGILFMRRRRRKRRKAALEGLQSQQSLSRLSATPPSNIDNYAPAPHALPGVWGGTANPRDYLEGSNLRDYLEGSGSRSFIAGSRSFSYEQLRIATKNFSESELLGKGGFGPVYRGTLPDDGTLVAVKCIADNSNQGAKEYKAEVTIISNLRHRNLVRLRGWCQDKGKFLLVYDYMPNGSLDHLLFNDKQCSKLSWERRYSIASGLGSALQYLHEECDNVIIHRDIKSSNVLLDESFNTKLGDFGLSRQVDKGITSLTTTVAGTHGYMAPECLLGPRKATRESDVYAFGAVLLELVCGKRAMDYASFGEEEGMLVDWVWHLHSQGKVMEAVDKRLEGEYDNEGAKRMLLVGLLCSNPDPKARPKVRRAFEALVGSVPLPSVPSAKPIMTFGPPPPMSITQILEDSSNTNSTSSSSTHPHSAASSDYVQRLP